VRSDFLAWASSFPGLHCSGPQKSWLLRSAPSLLLALVARGTRRGPFLAEVGGPIRAGEGAEARSAARRVFVSGQTPGARVGLISLRAGLERKAFAWRAASSRCRVSGWR